MNFEVQNALRDLDRKTPSYYLDEIFSHGDLKVRTDALKVLSELEPRQKTSRKLREMLRLT